MTTTKLTTKNIKSFVYQGRARTKNGRTIYTRDARWDTQVPGLGLRIYPSGRKAFVLSYRVRGRKRMMALGDFGAMTLGQGRDAARKQLALVREGRDPLEEKRNAARGRALGDLITAYVEQYAKPRKKTWKADQQRLDRNIPAAWRAREASAVMPWEVAKLHQEVGKNAPYEANRLLEILRRMYNIAPTLIALEGPLENPVKGIEKFPEKQRKRWLKPEELPALAKAIDRESNVYVRAAFWLYLLTGLRKAELLAARWQDVDWARGQLRLPDTKSGDEQFATLSAPALAILQAIPRLDGNPFILPGARKGRPLINIDNPWRRIRKAAKVEDLRLHDLRRTAGSWMAQAGTDLQTLREGLRHANISTTLIYARLGEDAARDAFEQYGRRILEAAGKRGPVEVVGGSADE